MDELAHLAKMDPLDFRLKNLTDARLREALASRRAEIRLGEGQTSTGAWLRHRGRVR